MNKPLALGPWFILIMLVLSCQVRGQKTDVIRLSNGNEITGEVKKLEFGKLSYSTDDFGTVSVNWKKVVSIKSDKVFEIETTQGYLFIGKLENTSDTGTVFIRAGAAGTEIRLIDITTIYPIKSRFFQRISGPVNIGAGYTQSNSLFQATYDGDLTYRGTRIYSGMDFSGAFSRQYDSVNTQRQQYSFVAGKKFRNHWYTGGIIGYEQNSELGIQSRLVLGMQFGRVIVQSIADNLNTFIALQATREYYYSDDPSTNNLELFIDIKYKHFLYYTPKSDITIELQFLPNLTDWGRIRSNFSVMLKQEIFSDFFVSLQGYIYFDNRPVTGDLKDIDWGVTTGLGYSF
jgi:hypothetical protein